MATTKFYNAADLDFSALQVVLDEVNMSNQGYVRKDRLGPEEIRMGSIMAESGGLVETERAFCSLIGWEQNEIHKAMLRESR